MVPFIIRWGADASSDLPPECALRVVRMAWGDIAASIVE
jgi:hypothetical protein